MPPLPIASRPASNCGFTSATSQGANATTAKRTAGRDALVRLMIFNAATVAPSVLGDEARIEAPRVGSLERDDPSDPATPFVQFAAADGERERAGSRPERAARR